MSLGGASGPHGSRGPQPAMIFTLMSVEFGFQNLECRRETDFFTLAKVYCMTTNIFVVEQEVFAIEPKIVWSSKSLYG